MKIVNINGDIELLSGLHIGGGDDTMKIGGVDNGVVKDVNSNKPYIPGSSIKGKMRSLLEWHLGLVSIGKGKPFNSKLLSDDIFKDQSKKKDAINLIKLFGNAEVDESFTQITPITRISVSDCTLIEEENLVVSEIKHENSINRKTGTAMSPRQTERVPAGVKFRFDIKIKVLKEDNEEELIEMVKKGLELIENDYLGGSGSRGYGRVKFKFEEKQ